MCPFVCIQSSIQLTPSVVIFIVKELTDITIHDVVYHLFCYTHFLSSFLIRISPFVCIQYKLMSLQFTPSTVIFMEFYSKRADRYKYGLPLVLLFAPFLIRTGSFVCTQSKLMNVLFTPSAIILW